VNNDRFKVRIWNVSGGYYLPDFYLTPAGEVCEFGVFNGTPMVRMFDNQAIFKKEYCTGLLDKNGKLIYEGDVVDMYIPQEDARRKCVVEYVIDSGTAQWVCRYIEGKRMHRIFGLSFAITGEPLNGDYCKIIGNIHEMELEK
jgi:uncharacterized phage protein (TIGR01671 family)